MDTSETYAKMCAKAKEIQDKWEGDNGDFYFRWYYAKLHHRGVQINSGGWGGIPGGERVKRKSIWLPRQDQLQEMVKLEPFMDRHWWFDGISRTECLIWGMVDLVDAGQNDYIFELNDYAKQFNSMEQYWLALVMKQKGKVWDGEDWVLSK